MFECVPNVSEGRDQDVVAACAKAIVAGGARLAHQTSDPHHNRSVFTFFGDRDAVVAASVALAAVCAERIDLRVHRGVHPRIGALDVLPFVPIGGATLADAVAVAHAAAAQIWNRSRLPSFFYDAAATATPRPLADVRRDGFEGLAARAAGGERPDVGDVLSHPRAGTIAVGARDVLIAFNIVLGGDDLEIARRIARRLRERTGGLRTLRALGLALGDGRIQIACNVTNYRAVPLHRVVGLVRRTARRHGRAIEGCELIGLVPRAALRAALDHALGADQRIEETSIVDE